MAVYSFNKPGCFSLEKKKSFGRKACTQQKFATACQARRVSAEKLEQIQSPINWELPTGQNSHAPFAM